MTLRGRSPRARSASSVCRRQTLAEAEFTSAEEDKCQGFPGNGPAVSGVGYDEPNYFSYVFKKRFGVTPSQFRK